MTANAYATTARCAIDVVEAAYSLDGDENEWLTRVLRAGRPDFESDGGSYAFIGRFAAREIEVGPGYVEHDLSPAFSAVIGEVNRSAPDALFDLMKRSAVVCGGFMEVVPEALRAHLRAFGGPLGVVDSFGLLAQDGEGWAVSISAPASVAVRASPRVRGIWNRVGMHLASGMRLRRRMSGAMIHRDAVFAPSGALEHAEGGLRDDRSSRAVLADAVKAVERARGSLRRTDPLGALELWKGLVAGQWSLVDSWESDGRRYVAAYRNCPHVPDPRRLTPLERTALRYVTLCSSNKQIAFALGLSEGTIAKAVGSILRKLRCRRRSDLLAFAQLEHSTSRRVADGAGELGLLAVAHGSTQGAEGRLTEAERGVARRVIAGDTNQEIAHQRGTSTHTVANQVRGIFDKLGVHSRVELVRALTTK